MAAAARLITRRSSMSTLLRPRPLRILVGVGDIVGGESEIPGRLLSFL